MGLNSSRPSSRRGAFGWASVAVVVCFLALMARMPAAALAESGKPMLLAKMTPEQLEKAEKALQDILNKKKKNPAPASDGSGDTGGTGESGGGDASSSGSSGDAGASGGTDTGSSSGSSGTSESTGSPAQPSDAGGMGGESTPGPKTIDPGDKMYCEAHMKNANRHFKKQDYDKAKAELDLIFERVPDFAVARFMRAVIAAKTKDYLTAWRNIEVARAQEPDNPKIKGFIEKLEKVSPKPDVIPDEKTTKQRSAPTFAATQWVDALESLIADKVGAKVAKILCAEPKDESGSIVLPVTFVGNDSLDQKAIEGKLTELGAAPGAGQVGSGGKELRVSLGAGSLPRVNPEVKAVEKLGTFLNETSNECDVQIKKSEEGEPNADKVVLGSYSVVARSWTQINDFLRKVTPHAVEYWVETLESTTMNQQSVWKGDLKIRFKTQ